MIPVDKLRSIVRRREELEQLLCDPSVLADPGKLRTLNRERTQLEPVVAAFEAWLAAREGGPPFFAWVHLYDPHAPYAAPEPFASRYPDDPYGAEIAYTEAGTVD